MAAYPKYRLYDKSGSSSLMVGSIVDGIADETGVLGGTEYWAFVFPPGESSWFEIFCPIDACPPGLKVGDRVIGTVAKLAISKKRRPDVFLASCALVKRNKKTV
jgi:hypothetical protein